MPPVRVGPSRIVMVSRGLLRVEGGGDKPEVLVAAAGLRSFLGRLKRDSDPLFRRPGSICKAPSPALPGTHGFRLMVISTASGDTPVVRDAVDF
jgi:hypothetical protein